MHHHGDAIVLPVDFRLGFDFCKRKAKLAELIGEGFGGRRHVVGVVNLPRFDGHQGLELVVLVEIVAFQPNGGNGKSLALEDVDGHRQVLLVGRNRHLGRVDPEFKIAAAEVIGAQRLQIGIELGPRVAIGLGVPTQPAACVQIEQVQEL